MCESHNRVAVSPSPRAAGAGWVLDAVFSNGKQAAIGGFRTQAEANAARQRPSCRLAARSPQRVFGSNLRCDFRVFGFIRGRPESRGIGIYRIPVESRTAGG